MLWAVKLRKGLNAVAGFVSRSASRNPGWLTVAYGQILPLVPGVTETRFPVPSLEIITKFAHLTLEPNVKETIPVGELFILGPVSLMPRKKTPVVMGTGTPLITKVASATVNGLNGFEIGTLMVPTGR